MKKRSEYADTAHALASDDRLLDAFGALTWDDEPADRPPTLPTPRPSGDDPLVGLLLALRGDVEPDAPMQARRLAPVIDLRQRRRVHRAAVGVAVAAAVLSVSGVAAAGVAGTNSPLYSIHKVIWGPTPSQRALHAAERFAALAGAHLQAGRLTAARNALDHADESLAAVDPEERGTLPERLAGLRDALTAAFAANDAALGAQGAANPRAHGQQAQGHGAAAGNGSPSTGDGKVHGKPDGHPDNPGVGNGRSDKGHDTQSAAWHSAAATTHPQA